MRRTGGTHAQRRTIHPPATDVRQPGVPWGVPPPSRQDRQAYRAYWQGWEDRHIHCEEQAHVDGPDLMPVVDLYVDGPHLNFGMGWCVDA